MKLALVQLGSPDAESQSDRIDRVERLLHGLTDVDLVVLPELWSAGYFHFAEYDDLAETLDGPTISMCARAAQKLNAYVHIGSIVEKDEDGQLHNTSILLNSDGAIIHSYRKVHVFGYQSLEASLLTAGKGLPVAQTPHGAVAGTTCYDLRFPGLWMELSNRGVEIVIVPAAWPEARKEHWRLLTAARAVEHQIFIIACNATGVQEGVQLGGHSRVVDPSGVVLAECKDKEEVLYVDIDPTEVARVRKEFPVIADRLSAYDALTK